MKAAVLRAVGQPLEIADVPVPEIAPDEVLVETRACGICRTDLHIQDGLAYVPALPHIPGHEPAGVVVAIGDRVRGLAPGDRVVPYLFVTCGRCRFCREGRDAQCLHVAGVLGVTLPGAFAEFFKAPARNLLTMPPGVPFAAAGLVSCALITAVHAYNRAQAPAEASAVVLGVGGIGQALVQLLVRGGARVAALGRGEESLAAARRYGAELALPFDNPAAVSQLREWAGDDGADRVFECVGTAATMRAAAELATRGGRVVVIGEEAEFPAVDTIRIAQRELEIVGSRNGSKQDATDTLQMLAAGRLVAPVAREIPLAGLNAALADMRAGRVHGRIVVSPGQ